MVCLLGFNPARAAGIASGTLFNYFPTKEAVAQALVREAYESAAAAFESDVHGQGAQPLSLEEELFAHVAAVLRRLKPFRKYTASVLEAPLAPPTLAPGDLGLGVVLEKGCERAQVHR